MTLVTHVSLISTLVRSGPSWGPLRDGREFGGTGVSCDDQIYRGNTFHLFPQRRPTCLIVFGEPRHTASEHPCVGPLVSHEVPVGDEDGGVHSQSGNGRRSLESNVWWTPGCVERDLLRPGSLVDTPGTCRPRGVRPPHLGAQETLTTSHLRGSGVPVVHGGGDATECLSKLASPGARNHKKSATFFVLRQSTVF